MAASTALEVRPVRNARWHKFKSRLQSSISGTRHVPANAERFEQLLCDLHRVFVLNTRFASYIIVLATAYPRCLCDTQGNGFSAWETTMPLALPLGSRLWRRDQDPDFGLGPTARGQP